MSGKRNISLHRKVSHFQGVRYSPLSFWSQMPILSKGYILEWYEIFSSMYPHSVRKMVLQFNMILNHNVQSFLKNLRVLNAAIKDYNRPSIGNVTNEN